MTCLTVTKHIEGYYGKRSWNPLITIIMKHIIFVSFVTIIFNSCIKEECKIAGGYYEFEIPAILTPEKDTFSIGDTITIISSFSDVVYERKTDKVYKLIEFKFFPGTEIKNIDTFPAAEGLSFFEILVDSSLNYKVVNFSESKMRIKGEYDYNNNTYYLKYQLVAKKSGLYYIEQSIYPELDPNQHFEGKCPNLKIDGAVKLNGGKNNNIDMLIYSPDPHYNNWIIQRPEDRFYKFGGYCFYVKN